MEAGPELDMLVEERVMGYCYECHGLSQRNIENDPEAARIIREECRYGSVVYVGDEGDVDADGNRFWYCGRHDKRMIQEAKPRSTDIAAAWEVVEKLVELGFDSWCVGDDEVYFEDSSTAPGPLYRFGAAIPGTKVVIPHAICLAALAAMSPGG